MRIIVNGETRECKSPLTVSDLVADLNLTGAWLAIAIRGNVVPRDRWVETGLQENDEVDIVRAVGGGSQEADDPLVLGGRTFYSRLFCGTGKFSTMDQMVAAHAAAGTEMVTVAIRYMDLNAPGGGDILSHLDLNKVQLLPNTAGAYTAEHAVTMARLAREATGTNWIKLEVIGDQETLLPDLGGTLQAAAQLVKEGFVVLPYTTADLITCLRLEDMGCAAVMPLASPIGTGQGLTDWSSIRRVVERVKIPVVVDAGIGCATDASQAMEIGASAVLVNTAIARAADPVLMAEAMKYGVWAGRRSHLAGRIAKTAAANPSSPTTGVPGRKAGEVE
ncbi:MAG TPA: sulfur carrier protein ThiS [Symbiobacteriaceae bacterium]|nr:sulfur carrier protein ThiS [Symbiobacteriaceae bacterium]